LGLKSKNEWFNYCKGELPGYDPKPEDIPTDAYGFYKKGKVWTSWPDWIGTATDRKNKK